MTLKSKREEFFEAVAREHGLKYAQEMFEEVDKLVEMAYTAGRKKEININKLINDNLPD